MHVVRTKAQVRKHLAEWRAEGARVALTPTMGNLHRGHLALIAAAAERADKVAVSIFVNPLQFDRKDDFRAYPRTLDGDLERLRDRGVSLVFAPAAEEIYPPDCDASIFVDPGELAGVLCGANRPGHFTGVATVIVKLFNLFTPDVAVFGEKDYQQLILIRRLVERLDFDVHVVAVPTVREADGLALSSRNSYLDAEQRKRAPALYRVLRDVAAQVEGNGDAAVLNRLAENARARLESAGLRPDYVEIRNARDLAPLDVRDLKPRDGGGKVVLAAAWLGKARLIDNVIVEDG